MLRELAIDNDVGIDFEGMPPCWQCSQQYGRRIAVAKVLVHEEPSVAGISVQCECHGETAHITIRNYKWPPGEILDGAYRPNMLQVRALQNIPFFSPHPEHELDYGQLRTALMAMIKAGEKRMAAAERQASIIRRGLT
jgi:hypothetical protein